MLSSAKYHLGVAIHHVRKQQKFPWIVYVSLSFGLKPSFEGFRTHSYRLSLCRYIGFEIAPLYYNLELWGNILWNSFLSEKLRSTLSKLVKSRNNNDFFVFCIFSLFSCSNVVLEYLRYTDMIWLHHIGMCRILSAQHDRIPCYAFSAIGKSE